MHIGSKMLLSLFLNTFYPTLLLSCQQRTYALSDSRAMNLIKTDESLITCRILSSFRNGGSEMPTSQPANKLVS